MKLVLLVMFILVLAASASALSIIAPSSVPANVSWGFSVRLDPTETWNATTVSIDGQPILRAYSNSTIVTDPYNGQFVLKSFIIDENTASTSGFVLYVSHMGLAKGGHTISAASESGSDSLTITSYVALDENFASQTSDRFESVSREFKSNDVDKNAMWNRVLADSKRLTSLESTENGLASNVSSLSGQVQGAASGLYDLQQKIALKDEQAAKAQASSPLAALENLVAGSAMPLAYLLAAVILIALFIFISQFVTRRMQEQSIYSRRDEHGLPLSSEQKVSGEGKFLGLGDGKWKFKEKEK